MLPGCVNEYACKSGNTGQQVTEVFRGGLEQHLLTAARVDKAQTAGMQRLAGKIQRRVLCHGGRLRDAAGIRRR